MGKRKSEIKKQLEKWFSNAERVVVAGIGNPIRMDDYVGVFVVQSLRGKVSGGVLLIECETVPESYIQQIIDFNPTHVLLIDAAILGLEPGETKLLNPQELVNFPALTTHMLPLRIFCEYLIKMTRAKISLLLIEPQKTDFGEGLTAKVAVSAKEIIKALSELLRL
ncbi:MAG: hydrogenase 3 maturation endopeptidase HyCI [Candidatus Bathyarchaeia archaeon]